MAHSCKSILIHCIDFRFVDAIRAFMKDEHMLGDCDVCALAGAAKNLCGGDKAAQETALRQIEISKRLHGINKVVIMQHADCGAYASGNAFASKEDEVALHQEELNKAAKVVLSRFPDITVEKLFADMEDGKISFRVL